MHHKFASVDFSPLRDVGVQPTGDYPAGDPDVRLDTMSESSGNAPLSMSKMFDVSMCAVLSVEDFEPSFSETEATMPSRIFKSPCWTPSPDTSRLWANLSPTSNLVGLVDVHDAGLGLVDVPASLLVEPAQNVLDALAMPHANASCPDHGQKASIPHR